MNIEEKVYSVTTLTKNEESNGGFKTHYNQISQDNPATRDILADITTFQEGFLSRYHSIHKLKLIVTPKRK